MVGQVLIEAAGLDRAEYGGLRDNRRLSGRAVSDWRCGATPRGLPCSLWAVAGGSRGDLLVATYTATPLS